MPLLNPHAPMNIIFADDNSQNSLAAVNLLCDLPLSEESMITVVGVLAPREAANYAVLEANLENTKALLEERCFEVKMEILGGNPDEKLVEYAEEHYPDLMVLGARGRRAALGILLGGVAQQVIEYSHWPVLIVRTPYQGLRRVLVVTDGSPDSQRALEYFAQFPLPAAAEVEVMHILAPILHGQQVAKEKLDWKTQEECEGQTILEQASKILQSAGLKAATVLRRGDAASEIMDHITQKHIDLVVAGSRGLTHEPNWLLGSVSRKLVHYSDTSVLLVRGRPRRY